MSNFTNNYYTQLQSRCGDDDFRERTLQLGTIVKVVTLDSMCDDVKVVEYVVKPLLLLTQATPQQIASCTFATQVQNCANFSDVVDKYLSGYALIFVDGNDNCMAVDTFVAMGRSINEPPTSTVMRGPREGFVESSKVNLMLIRKRLRTEKLKTTNVTVGKYTNTHITVCYLDGVASQQLVNQIVQTISAFCGNADFSRLGRSTNGNIYIGDVLHKTFIAVDELGTKAAAVTKVEMKATGALIEKKKVYLDRPFVYMIVDNATNLPIFIGTLTEIE